MEKGVPKETLDRVHAPIGLDIHSETPEEIGVSIIAELIKARGEPLLKQSSWGQGSRELSMKFKNGKNLSRLDKNSEIFPKSLE